MQEIAIKNKSKKASFLQKALSSGNPKEVWETAHWILDPPKKCINQSPESLNQHFTELAPKLINKENVAFDQTKLKTTIPEQESEGAFRRICHKTHYICHKTHYICHKTHYIYQAKQIYIRTQKWLCKWLWQHTSEIH